MKFIKTKKKTTITTNLLKVAENYDIAGTIKIIKKNPINDLIESVNQIDDAKLITFILVAASQTKTKNLLLSLNFSKIDEVLAIARSGELKSILKGLWPDQIFQLINEHKEFAKDILLNVDSDTRQEVKRISKYDEDEVGHIMNPEFLTLNENWTINKCLNVVKKEMLNVENINTLFVVNDDNQLVGSVKLHDIFFANKYSNKVITISDTNPISITHKGSIDEVIQMFDKYTIDTLAVCNHNGVLQGVIKNSDIVQAIQDETTDDIYKMYGMAELSFPYLNAPVKNIVKSRILWLIVLMISATITSFIIDRFQFLGDQWTSGLSTLLLVPIIPVLTGTSGNAGSQSSASIIRALSIGDITNREYAKAIRKELYVGFCIGLILALINFIRLVVYYACFFNDQLLVDGVLMSPIDSYTHRIIIAATSSLTLFISIILSKLLGSSLPILAVKMHIDPSVMSAPILATLLDITTTTLLFGIGLGVTLLIF